MKVKALVPFAGVVTMCPGEEKEIEDPQLVRSLLQAGYIEELKSPGAKADDKEEEEAPKASSKPKRRTKK